MTAQEYAMRYIEARNTEEELFEIEFSFLMELTREVRCRNLIYVSQLVPYMEILQRKWLEMRSIVAMNKKPGQLPVKFNGFLEICRDFFPSAYFRYVDAYPQ